MLQDYDLPQETGTHVGAGGDVCAETVRLAFMVLRSRDRGLGCDRAGILLGRPAWLYSWIETESESRIRKGKREEKEERKEKKRQVKKEENRGK